MKPTRLCGQYIGHNRGEFGSFVLLGKGMAAVSRYWPSQNGNGDPCCKRRKIIGDFKWKKCAMALQARWRLVELLQVFHFKLEPSSLASSIS